MDKNTLDSAVNKYKKEAVAKFTARLGYHPPSEIGCSFCHRPLSEIKSRVVGTNVSMCENCVSLAFDALKDASR